MKIYICNMIRFSGLIAPGNIYADTRKNGTLSLTSIYANIHLDFFVTCNFFFFHFR